MEAVSIMIASLYPAQFTGLHATAHHQARQLDSRLATTSTCVLSNCTNRLSIGIVMVGLKHSPESFSKLRTSDVCHFVFSDPSFSEIQNQMSVLRMYNIARESKKGNLHIYKE